jgi:hypothetical protein
MFSASNSSAPGKAGRPGPYRHVGIPPTSARHGGRIQSEHDMLSPAGLMFTDLFHLIHSLEHDYKEEKGQKVHSYDCRRCALTVRLSCFKRQILQLLCDIDFAIGESIEKGKK